MTVNQRFEDLLYNKKVSALKFAELSGLKPRNIQNVVNGQTEFPRIDIIQAVAKHYPDVSLRWLLIGEGEMYLSEGQLSMVKDISDQERTRLVHAIGEKELTIMDRNEKLNYLSDLMIRFGKLLSQLPIMQESGGDKLKALEEMLEEGLRKIEKE